MGFTNVRRVIDNTLLYQLDLEKAFHHVAEYLKLVRRNGIILNPQKVTIGAKEVDWAGIRVTENKVVPLAEHMDAIANFPKPMNLTDMRSYWALVSQVAPFYAAQKHLVPC